MGSVCVSELEDALRNTLGRKGMTDEDTKKLARYIMNFFGYDEAIFDNLLTAKDRDVFYMLEEEGILTTDQEEIMLPKNKLWRIHYWVLRVDEIKKLAKKSKEKEKGEGENYSVYGRISDDVWEKHSHK